MGVPAEGSSQGSVPTRKQGREKLAPYVFIEFELSEDARIYH